MKLPRLAPWPQWTAAIATGLLWALAFEPWNFQILAWIAFTPLLSVILPMDPQKKCDHALSLGWVAGMIFWVLTLDWLRHVTFWGMIALSAYLAFYPALWCFFLARVRIQWPAAKGWLHLLVALYGAASWVSLEWMRSWMLGGFPWNDLAISQTKNLAFIQIADLTGSSAVSFVLIFFNLCFWLTIRRMVLEKFSARRWRYEFSVALLVAAVCLLYGMRYLLKRPGPSATDASFKVALIQPNIPQEIKYEVMSIEKQHEKLAQLSAAAAAGKPDLIIWPETALVDGFRLETQDWLRDLQKELKTPLLVGNIDKTLDSKTHRFMYYNAAFLMDVDGRHSPTYHKLHLVPFGEYIPMEDWLPWLRFVIPPTGAIGAGSEPILFDFQNIKIGPLICFEDTFSDLACTLARNGADVLFNLTNDGWFLNSSGAAIHAANSVYRTIETRRPLIRATNTGLTMIISPEGQITQRIPSFTDGFLLAGVTIQKDRALTFYVRHGEWFPVSSVLASFVLLALAFGRSPIQKLSKPETPVARSH